MSAALAGRPSLTAAQSPKLSTLPASGGAYGAHRTGSRARKLQVVACHRCLARQLVSPLQPHRGGASGGTARGPAAPAALREVPQQQGAGDNPLTEQQERQGGTAPQREQAAAVQPPEPAEQQGREQQQSAGVAAALAMLRFYKSAISPLLPPACRFLPTCSVYAMEAYQRFGVGKGTVLTAWRLLRCAPWGNRGYDPVRWPPPGLEFLSGGGGSDGSGSSSSDSSGSGSGGNPR